MRLMAESQPLPADAGWSPETSTAPAIPIGQARRLLVTPELREAVAQACALVPPLWTLRNFVAVNAYLGFGALDFRDAVDEVDRIFHADALMPLAFYRDQHARGRIGESDLRAAVLEASAVLGRPELAELSPDRLLESLVGAEPPAAGGASRVRTLAEAVDRAEGSRWSQVAVDEISKWCAARFDAGQASWKQPWAERPLYEAWRRAACHDRSPELRGLSGFRAYVQGLPEGAMETIAVVLDQLDIPPARQRDHLARCLASIAGWAGHVQGRVREAGLAGREDGSLRELLAVRLAWEGALDHALGGRRELLRAPESPAALPAGTDEIPQVVLDERDQRMLWQVAYEGRYQGGLLRQLAGAGAGASAASRARPRLQAVFCIDVRSERLRRSLERISPEIQTLGFAGFFGFPIEYRKVGQETGSARCPVLIAPDLRLLEQELPGSGAEARRLRARDRHEGFAGLRKASVAAYPLVETVGHFFGLRLLTDSLGWTRPHAGGALFAPPAGRELAPSIRPERRGSEVFGLSLADRVELAEGALRTMGLTRDFAEVVLLCGHGSSSTNNPYASGLDCGACGGHPGDVNARVAAAVLEDPAVREALAERGIRIPDDTVFIGGLHDTTLDAVELFDGDRLRPDLRATVDEWLRAACERTREERAIGLGERGGRRLARRLRRRARDWSELRPEWGLAGNAAFVAAPRAHTRALDLQGRVFLHDYDPARDEDGRILEGILTAPLVVASWINLQYFASTTDNGVFGSGNKALHNVVGRHGVMLGNRSDLRPGLPWQSLHDGCDYVHEPLRLTAVVEAPRERVARILDDHPELGETVEKGWIHLLVRDPEEGGFHRFRGGSIGWQPVSVEPVTRDEPPAPTARGSA